MSKWLLNFCMFASVSFMSRAQEPIDSSSISLIQTVSIDSNAVNQFPFIQFVEPIPPPSFPENNTAVTLNRSNYLNSPSNNGLKYDGTGVNVMMQDDGIIGEHIDYQGRLDQSYTNSNNGDHGDHVAGTIMGAGNLDPLIIQQIEEHKFDNIQKALTSLFFYIECGLLSL